MKKYLKGFFIGILVGWFFVSIKTCKVSFPAIPIGKITQATDSISTNPRRFVRDIQVDTLYVKQIIIVK